MREAMLLVLGLSLALTLSACRQEAARIDRAKVYRIGYGNDIPYHFREDDGEPSGLAHDLVAAAAQHQGIKLEWVETDGFDQSTLDFWVLMTIKPDRRKSTYFTEPYLQTGSCFLVLDQSDFRDIADLQETKVSHANYGVHIENLETYLPLALRLPRESSRNAVKALLDGEADCAYLDQYATLKAVLEGQLSTSVRVIDAGFPSIDMALASTFENAPVADTIRDGMTLLTEDGTMSRLINRWALFPNVTDNMVEGLVAAERRIRLLAATLGITLCALGTSVWLALRLRGQTRRLKSAQASLKDSAEQYRAIVENTGDVVYAVDPEGKINFLGPQAVRYGISPQAAVGKNILEFIDESDRQSVQHNFQKTLETGIESTTEFRLESQEKGALWFEERGRLIRDERGEVVGVTGALRDISERKRAEGEQRELEERFRHAQKMEAIGLLAGGIAHDFNNILAAMTINLDLMKGNPKADEELRTGIKELAEACERATGLTRQLLTYSRRSSLELKPLALGEVVESMLSLVQRLLGESIQVEYTRLGSELPTIQGDLSVLQQVLLNLCVNARDAMPEGGTISIETEVTEARGVPLAASRGRSMESVARLTLTDTGSGMDDKTRARIFDPFFTTKEEGRGSGLGLATVHRAVEQHQGWIEVVSNPDQGTTFQIYFPLSHEPIAPASPPPATPVGIEGERILVVEDDPAVLSIALRVLKKLGYQVVSASCGTEAMEVWGKHQDSIRLLLTDVVLPGGMSGIEIAERLRAQRSNLPVIISSGFNNEDMPESLERSPEVKSLPKPYTIAELGNTVRDCLKIG